MSGLVSLFSSIGGSTNPVLSALYGSGGTRTGNPVQALQTAERNQTQDVAITAAQPAVARDIAAFQKAVTSATSPAQLLANPTVQKVLLTASGMSDQIGFSALIKQALLSDPGNQSSLINQLTDTRWKTVNQTYNFATQGLSVIQTPSVLAKISNDYAQQLWMQSLDATTPGMSNAISFLGTASSIKSVYQILGDPIMRSVVTTTLGIPQQIAFQDLNAQQTAISSRVDISYFKDPNFVNAFTQQYLLAAAGNSSTTGSGTSLDSLAVQAQGLVV